MRSPLLYSRLSATLDTHVSARTTAYAGDCTRSCVLGYLFDMSQHKQFRLFAYISATRVCGYMYIYKANRNYLFFYVLFPFFKHQIFHSSDLECPKQNRQTIVFLDKLIILLFKIGFNSFQSRIKSKSYKRFTCIQSTYLLSTNK